MSGAIPGHGYRAGYTVIPACKCGWAGRRVGPGPSDIVEDMAKKQFESHKHRVRKETGYAPKTAPRRSPKTAVTLRLVQGGEA